MGALAYMCSKPDLDIQLAGKTNKQIKLKEGLRSLFCFGIFCFLGALRTVLLFDLPCYLAVQVVALAQKKGCQEG